MRKFNILFFVNKGMSTPTARFRGYFFSKKIKSSNNNSQIYKVDEIYKRYEFSFKRLKKMREYFYKIKNTKKNDIIYLVKTVYNIDFLLIILIAKFFLRKRIIFDFDDAIYLKPFTKISTLILVGICDIVIVGSNTLFKWVKKRNTNIYKLPTSIPHEDYKRKYFSKKSKIFTIGWIGNGTNHFKNLIILKPIFEKLIRKKINFRFKLIGLANNKKILNFFNSIEGLNFEYKNHIKWENTPSVVRELNSFDVGIMPLVKDKKTLAKCAFKIIEYMGAGIPVIASPVGENNVVIDHTVNGFLCKKENDWVETFIKLKKEKKLKKKIILNAFENIRCNYSLESNMHKLFRILK
jgi:glycosyltransferase involved in cell wall biosynthesis